MRSLERAHVAPTERCLGPGRRYSLRATAYKVWSFPSGEWETVSHYTSDISSMKVVVTLLEALVLNLGPVTTRLRPIFLSRKKKALLSMFSKGTVAWKGTVGSRNGEEMKCHLFDIFILQSTCKG